MLRNFSPASNLVIRPTTRLDLPVVKKLFYELHSYNSSFDSTFALDPHWENVFENHYCELSHCQRASVIAEVSQRPAGLMLLKEHCSAPAMHQFRRWVEVQALYISPEYRRIGVGESLLAFAQQWSQANNHTWIQLYVTHQNQAAQHFYSKQDFRCTQQIWRKKV